MTDFTIERALAEALLGPLRQDETGWVWPEDSDEYTYRFALDHQNKNDNQPEEWQISRWIIGNDGSNKCIASDQGEFAAMLDILQTWRDNSDE